jgi:hypothetical protein
VCEYKLRVVEEARPPNQIALPVLPRHRVGEGAIRGGVGRVVGVLGDICGGGGDVLPEEVAEEGPEGCGGSGISMWV